MSCVARQTFRQTGPNALPSHSSTGARVINFFYDINIKYLNCYYYCAITFKTNVLIIIFFIFLMYGTVTFIIKLRMNTPLHSSAAILNILIR